MCFYFVCTYHVMKGDPVIIWLCTGIFYQRLLLLVKPGTLLIFFIADDLNTDFSRNTPQTGELSQYCNNECIAPLCKHNVSTVEYTYESVSNGTRSHNDHILVTSNLEWFIVKYVVVDHINNSSDNLPVIAEFLVSYEYLCTSKPAPKPKVAWYTADLGDINKYEACIDTHLDGVLGNHNNSAIECRNLNCKDKEHIFQFEQLHNELLTACLQSPWTMLPSSGGAAFVKPGQCVNHQPVPGYNEFVKNQRETAMFWHWLWKEMLSKWLTRMKVSFDQQEWLKLLLKVIIVTCGEKEDD